MYMISKRFSFSASHQLDQMPEGHQCKRLHGHNYVVTLSLHGYLLGETTNFLVDYGELKPMQRLIDAVFEHRHLNETMRDGRFTTAENLARHFFHAAWVVWEERVYSVAVKETDRTEATYIIGPHDSIPLHVTDLATEFVNSPFDVTVMESIHETLVAHEWSAFKDGQGNPNAGSAEPKAGDI